jgi:superfamily I DNA/RNA helicase
MVTIKTFHAFCLDVIRLEAKAIGLGQSLCVLNQADQRHMLKLAMEQAASKVPALRGDVDKIQSLISLAKQLMLSPEDDIVEHVSNLPAAISPTVFAHIYKAYQQLLSKNHLLDFDDLIFKTVRLFEVNETIRKRYEQRFSFISVDEYQDINYAQYRLIRLIAPPTHDICVIGDANQAIYGFRGSDVRYFHEFCKDYPGAKRICLNQSYRSTETILRASGQVMVAERTNTEERGIWSGIHGAKALTIARLPTERAEAEHIVKTIEEEVGGISHFSVDSGRIDFSKEKKERGFSDFAVLYRVKEQAKALKEAFARSGIPFQSVGGEKLENRKGIRELISYLKAGLSLASDFDVERILDFPSRGISPGTVKALKAWCETTGNSFVTALDHAGEIEGLSPSAKSSLMAFSEDLGKLKERVRGRDVYEQIELILDQTNIMDEMSDDKAFEENLATLLAISRSFADRSTEFLARLSLENEQDMYDPRAERVALMTMHASKGLEFSVLFIAGCEDGLIPYRKKKDHGGDPAEERRLFYVALTRAQEKVFLTHVNERLWFGQKTKQRISPFVESIEEDLKQYKRPFLRRPAPKKEDPQLKLFEL